jgi:HNH endonuclease/Helix-turn-helix domain
MHDRFRAKIDDSAGLDGCWLWTARIATSGYGRIGGNYAHRIAWLLEHGAIPDGMDVAHRCNVKACVNPAHLYVATRSQNLADAHRDGLIARSLTSAQRRIIDVMLLQGLSNREIARRVGVNRYKVDRYVRGTTFAKGA